MTDSIADKWVELYEGGMSSVQIAEEFGFTSTTILEYLRRAGVDTGPIITREEAIEIKRRYEAGDTVQALSLEYGVTDTYIRVKLKEQGVEIREPVRGFVFSEEEIADWCRRYDSGESISSIEMYGVTPTAASTSLKLQGIEIRHRPTDDSERAIWLSMYNDGMSVPSIADTRGVDKSVVYRYLKSQGITFEKHPRKPITELDLEWKRLYLEEQRSLSFIAKKYCVSPTTVSKHLSKLGVVVVRKSNHLMNN